MWVNLLCIFVAVPLVISWPAGYDEHALEEPLADDVPAYFKGIRKTAFTFAFHVHFVHGALKSLKMSRSAMFEISRQKSKLRFLRFSIIP